ncbi:MAG TPA: hypothetical protein VEK33_18405 [Terriglobales bacterium]|nr:hypothetical protein [Terriglobales bacterium]
MKQKSPVVMFSLSCVQRQAAAVGVLLGFLGLGILGFAVRTGLVAASDYPGAVKPLAQGTEEFSDILCEKAGLLDGGKVAAPGHDCPAQEL